MKNISLIIPVLMLTGGAQASPAWVKTPFWKAPAVHQVRVKIVNQEKGLAEVCRQYGEQVLSAPGKTLLEKEQVEYFRTEEIDIRRGLSFKARFRMDVEATNAILNRETEALNARIPAEKGKDALPYYTNETAQIVPSLQATSAVRVEGSDLSLTQVSASVGLGPAKVRVLGDGAQAVIEVLGKDLACDLLEGRARIQFESLGKVAISLEDQVKSNELYKKFEDLTKEVFGKKRTPTGRAALMGFRLSEVLAPLRLDRSTEEIVIGSLVETFFDDKMERNRVWTSFSGEHRLSIPGSVPHSMTVTLEK